MSNLVPRFISRFYRKEPISSFLLTIGLMDAIMGSMGGKWGLFSFSAVVLLLGIGVRWWHLQSPDPVLTERQARRYLPPSSSSQALPDFSKEKNQSL